SADFAQHADRFGQSELFTGEASDKTAAADLAARLEPAINAQQVAPGRQPCCLTFKQAPKHDAVANHQCACEMLDCFRSGLSPGVGPASQRPAASAFHAEHR